MGVPGRTEESSSVKQSVSKGVGSELTMGQYRTSGTVVEAAAGIPSEYAILHARTASGGTDIMSVSIQDSQPENTREKATKVLIPAIFSFVIYFFIVFYFLSGEIDCLSEMSSVDSIP
jgi:hypothetical protein